MAGEKHRNDMISVDEIKAQALKSYTSFLSAAVTGDPFFPKEIRFRRIRPSEALQNYHKLREGLRLLRKSSKEHLGYGYTVDYTEITNRNVGKQNFPIRIYFDSRSDYLKFIGKDRETSRFFDAVDSACNEFPELREWFARNPHAVLKNLSVLSDSLKVCRYFGDNPYPNLYIRELPIDIHTKFIEQNKGFLSQMLDIVLGPKVKRDETDFERRYGLKYDEPLIRLRALDQELSRTYLAGLHDISIPLSEFCSLNIPVSIVFIMENKTNLSNIMNFLTLPQVSGGIAVFGKGYSVHLLKDVHWLKGKRILYWGDIDCHGFEILSILRGYLPQTESVMMDFETFNSFKEYRVSGGESNSSSLINLTQEELKLYEYLRGVEGNNRLEQEKIPHSFAILKFTEAISCPKSI